MDLSTSAFAVIGNSLKERSIGIGRAADVGPLDDNECYMVQRTANMIELYNNHTVHFEMDALQFLQDNGVQNSNGVDSLIDLILDDLPL